MDNFILNSTTISQTADEDKIVEKNYNDNEFQYKCTECPLAFNFEDRLEQHTLCHNNKNDLQLAQRCPIYVLLQKSDNATTSTSTQKDIEFDEECEKTLFTSIKELQDHFLKCHSEYSIELNEVYLN